MQNSSESHPQGEAAGEYAPPQILKAEKLAEVTGASKVTGDPP